MNLPIRRPLRPTESPTKPLEAAKRRYATENDLTIWTSITRSGPG